MGWRGYTSIRISERMPLPAPILHGCQPSGHAVLFARMDCVLQSYGSREFDMAGPGGRSHQDDEDGVVAGRLWGGVQLRDTQGSRRRGSFRNRGSVPRGRPAGPDAPGDSGTSGTLLVVSETSVRPPQGREIRIEDAIAKAMDHHSSFANTGAGAQRELRIPGTGRPGAGRPAPFLPRLLKRCIRPG
jgi:hypothetical protein